jgi:hypothetical protein
MFNFLNLFSNGASIFATGTSLVNTYAQLKANGEKKSQALYEQSYYKRQLEEEQKFNQSQIFERTAEYGAISSYQVDILRQEQMHNRQQLGYNILQSGIGITHPPTQQDCSYVTPLTWTR